VMEDVDAAAVVVVVVVVAVVFGRVRIEVEPNLPSCYDAEIHTRCYGVASIFGDFVSP